MRHEGTIETIQWNGRIARVEFVEKETPDTLSNWVEAVCDCKPNIGDYVKVWMGKVVVVRKALA